MGVDGLGARVFSCLLHQVELLGDVLVVPISVHFQPISQGHLLLPKLPSALGGGN